MGWRLVWTDLRRVRESSAACANNEGGRGHACSFLSAAEGDSSIGLPVVIGLLSLMMVPSIRVGTFRVAVEVGESIVQESFRAPEAALAIKTPNRASDVVKVLSSPLE